MLKLFVLFRFITLSYQITFTQLSFIEFDNGTIYVLSTKSDFGYNSLPIQQIEVCNGIFINASNPYNNWTIIYQTAQQKDCASCDYYSVEDLYIVY
jgi:hypothetical protein